MIAANNVMNIRYNHLNRWLGLVGETKGFCVFSDRKYCIRAALILLRTYRRKGIRTPQRIIFRYAPPKENDSSSYLRFVCKNLFFPHVSINSDR